MNPSTQHKPILFSGIQPSGVLGLGHYLGAIRHWLAMQADHHCYFSAVDLHTLTVRQDPAVLTKHSYDMIAMYLACGLDPEVSCLFMQSAVPEHCELAWLLACQTMMGELNRMTQFKDKSTRHQDNINAGLFSYPTLMAADILLYDTNVVPVGEDQKQHLELTRDLAQRFNHHFGETFVIPEPMIAASGARIMGLQDPGAKMSKSDVNQNNVIGLMDSPKAITKKIKSAVTDSDMHVAKDPSRPGISNLVEIYAAVSGDDEDAIEKRYQGQGYGVFKSDLAELLLSMIEPIQKDYHRFRGDEAELRRILKQGAEKARHQAEQKCAKVKARMGLLVK